MRYDTVIIGGGLSALMCGIELARNGKRAALVAAGQSTMNFSSASFGLYNAPEPLKAIAQLPQSHPYTKVGVEQVEALAGVATEIFNIAGISTVGSAERNHKVITPVGQMRECWLSIDGVVATQDDKLDFNSAALFVPEGFLDIYTSFITSALQQMGVMTSLCHFSLPELVVRRNNPTEMRSVSVARALDKEENLRALASIIVREAGDAEVVLLPATLGFAQNDVRERLERMTDRRVLMIPTLPPSVEGVKAERALRRAFEKMGGAIFAGHTATSYQTDENGEIVSVTTSKDVTLMAENFVLASGSFIGRGLEADRQGVCEPLFGSDIIGATSPLTDIDIYSPQPFMGCGVDVDEQFHILKQGKSVDNLYACGSILGGYNPVKEGCGAGVAIITALSVAQTIINR